MSRAPYGVAPASGGRGGNELPSSTSFTSLQTNNGAAAQSTLALSTLPWSGTLVAPSDLSYSAGTSSAVTAASTGTGAHARRQVIGKYELGKVLAVGDFDCWTRLCTHVVTGAQYVVRTYRKDILREVQWMWDRVHDSIHVQRFLPKHPGIVEMVECFETEAAVYILMQLFPSLNATKIYTTRQLHVVAPFLAEKLGQAQPRSSSNSGALMMSNSYRTSTDGRGATAVAAGRDSSPLPDHSARGDKKKQRSGSGRTGGKGKSVSPPSSGRLGMRTPPLEQLDIRYTSPLPLSRPVAVGLNDSDGSSLDEKDDSARRDKNAKEAGASAAGGGGGVASSRTSPHSPVNGGTNRGIENDYDRLSDDKDEDEEDDDDEQGGTRRAPKVPMDTTRTLFIQVVRAVQHMHRNAVVHLGLAPDHIMVSERGVAKVGNLISCRQCTPGETLRELRGTRQTVAPEVLRGEAYDPFLADSWSLGVVLYFMLNDGRYPHDGANTLQHVLYQHIRPPNPSIPPTAKDLLSRLLQMNPVNRLSVDAILMHPFCVGAWQQMEEECHRKAESTSNPSAVATAAAAAAAAVAASGGGEALLAAATAGGVGDDASVPGENTKRNSGPGEANTSDQRAAGGLFGSNSAPVVATAPTVIASARLLSEPSRSPNFLDDNGLRDFTKGTSGGISAFARARGVFLRAPGSTAHVWGQGQGQYGQDVGAGAGLLFEVQPANNNNSNNTVPSTTGAVTHYNAIPSASSTATIVVANGAGAQGLPGSGGVWSAATQQQQQQQVRTINAATLLGSRASAVQSNWDPVQEAFSIDIPPALTRENEAAYVIQHTFRAYLQRRRYRRATRRLNRIGWRVFEGLYTSPPPPPPAAMDDDDDESQVWYPQRRLSRQQGRLSGGRSFRGRSFLGGSPAAGQFGRRRNPSESRANSLGTSGRPRGSVLPPSPSYGPRSAARPRYDEHDSSYDVFSIDSSTSDLSKPASRTVSTSSMLLAAPPPPLPFQGKPPRRSTLLPRGADNDDINNFDDDNITTAGGGGGGDYGRDMSYDRAAARARPGHKARAQKAARMSGALGEENYYRDATDDYEESYGGAYDSYGGIGGPRRSWRSSNPRTSGGGGGGAGPGRQWLSSMSAYDDRLPSLSQPSGLAGTQTVTPQQQQQPQQSAAVLAALALKSGDQSAPAVSAKEDCPLCHRPPPLAKKINIAPYALTHYEYKSGDFTRNAN